MDSTAGNALGKWGQALSAITFMVGLGVIEMAWSTPIEKSNAMSSPVSSQASATTLDARQQSVIVLAALAAAGDMPRLNTALESALDAGLTISEVREVLVQLYAYAGFPRSLNALSELMRVVQARKQRGISDDPGREPSRPIPQGDALLAAGTANQTQLSGSPVEGPLFDFAPVANQYLRAHLFGDIFERDNLSWQMRELATLGMLSALDGVQPQLQAHVRIGMNTGITQEQLGEVCETLERRVGAEVGKRAADALGRYLAGSAGG